MELAPILISFVSSFGFTISLVAFQQVHLKFSADNQLNRPQKMHSGDISRIGGIAILMGALIAGYIFFLTNKSNLVLILCLGSIPAFAIGITEDITKRIGVRLRLIFILLSACFLIYLLKYVIVKVNIPIIDDLLLDNPIIKILFTIFAIVGIVNAYNIIDGLNGLSSMSAMITLLGIIVISIQVADYEIACAGMILTSAILGFFICNYPLGKIFLGDSGAYTIGLWIALLSIALTCRHQEISPWAMLMLNAYPVTETIFTIYRRSLQKKLNPSIADRLHLHSLIFRRLFFNKKPIKLNTVRNAHASTLLWFPQIICMVMAVIWKYSTCYLAIAYLTYALLYIFAYQKLIKFKFKIFFIFN